MDIACGKSKRNILFAITLSPKWLTYTVLGRSPHHQNPNRTPPQDCLSIFMTCEWWGKLQCLQWPSFKSHTPSFQQHPHRSSPVVRERPHRTWIPEGRTIGGHLGVLAAIPSPCQIQLMPVHPITSHDWPCTALALPLFSRFFPLLPSRLPFFSPWLP